MFCLGRRNLKEIVVQICDLVVRRSNLQWILSIGKKKTNNNNHDNKITPPARLLEVSYDLLLMKTISIPVCGFP